MNTAKLWIAMGLVIGGCGHNADQPDASTHAKDGGGDGATGDAGPCNAPMTVCGTACVDLQTDPQHCGACDHVCGCGETTCTAGVCDSQALAAAQGAPDAIALQGGTLYWGDDVAQNVSTLPVAGGTPTQLFASELSVRGFAFDTTRVYFTSASGNAIEAGHLDGSKIGSFSAPESSPDKIVADATAVYWADYLAGTIRTAKLGDTGAGTTIASGQTQPFGVALDATNLYWTTNSVDGNIMKMPKAGGTPTAIATGQDQPLNLATDGVNVYWTNQGNNSPQSGSVKSVPVGGGTVTTYAATLPSPGGIAIDASFVYWTDELARSVMRAPLAGGGSASVVSQNESAPQSVVVDATCMYFTDYGNGMAGSGSIRRHDLD